jgi:hypothetical protein
MINSIISSSRLLQITVGSNYIPYVNVDALSSGTVRYNPNSHKLEIFDGGSNSWHEYPGQFVSIDFAFDVEETIGWAKTQMRKERDWQRLAENNPGMKVVLENYYKSREHLEILSYLIEKNNDQDTK